jgi:hydroxymethylglutaryl-CoA synthase
MSDAFGILSYGAYLPRRRLQRKVIAAANSWFNPGLRALSKGERAMANWDEDAVTMAVEAARDCLSGVRPAAIGQLMLASTTHPYDDRQNAGIVATALHLGSALRVLDVTGSLRAGTSALGTALAAGGSALVAAGEHRLAKAASPQEMHYGDGAAALLVGCGEPIAHLVAAHSETVDFVHQYRGHDRAHDYAWEERWIRDEGYMKIVPAALAALFEASGTPASSVTHFCMPCTLPRVAAGLAKRVGLAETAARQSSGGLR